MLRQVDTLTYIAAASQKRGLLDEAAASFEEAAGAVQEVRQRWRERCREREREEGGQRWRERCREMQKRSRKA